MTMAGPALGLLERPELAVRHGARGRRLFRRQHRCDRRVFVRDGCNEIREPGRKMADLPAGDINHHWTKNVIASRDGKHLYVTIGSNSNVAENGIDKEGGRAAIVEIDLATGKTRPFATGLRNPNGIAWNPATGSLWTTVNERDEIGSDLVPDYLTAVQDGAFYGWPYSYYGQHVDDRVQPARPDLVSKAIVPDYALGSHVAPLGLVFVPRRQMAAMSSATSAVSAAPTPSPATATGAPQGSGTLPRRFASGAFGEHGSWNRQPERLPGWCRSVRQGSTERSAARGADRLCRPRRQRPRPPRWGSPSGATVRCSSPMTSATRSGASVLPTWLREDCRKWRPLDITSTRQSRAVPSPCKGTGHLPERDWLNSFVTGPCHSLTIGVCLASLK